VKSPSDASRGRKGISGTLGGGHRSVVARVIEPSGQGVGFVSRMCILTGDVGDAQGFFCRSSHARLPECNLYSAVDVCRSVSILSPKWLCVSCYVTPVHNDVYRSLSRAYRFCVSVL